MLLHGNSAHADWYSFIAPLLKAGRRVVAMSSSGMGGSGWRTQYSVAQWADEALAVAEATGLFDGPVPPVVAAHSFGGFVLMNLASRHGQRLGRAVIVDTPLRPPAAGRGAAQPARAAALGQGPCQRGRGTAALPPAAAAGCCAHPFIADLIARRGLKQTTGPDGRPGWVWRFDPFLFRHFAFGRPLKELRAAQCPVTLVRGGRSRLVTPELMQLALEHAPAGTPLLEVPDADHHVMVDQPLAFAALLAELVPAA